MRNRRDTYLFSIQDTKKIDKAMQSINYTTELVKPQEFEDQLKVFQKRYSYALKNFVIDNYVKGNILTVMPLTDDIPKLIPIFLISTDNGNRAVVNIKPYTVKNKNGEYIIEEKKLYAFLEQAFIDLNIYKSMAKFENRISILNYATVIYVKMFNKVLDKLYAINLIPSLSDKVNFVIGNFFLRYVIGKENEDLINGIAYSATFNQNFSKEVLTMMCQDFILNNSYDTFPGFVEALARSFPELSSLTLRSFLENYMVLFGEVSIYSLESFVDLLHTVLFGVVFNINIVRDNMLDKTIGKEAIKLYNEVTTLCY